MKCVDRLWEGNEGKESKSVDSIVALNSMGSAVQSITTATIQDPIGKAQASGIGSRDRDSNLSHRLKQKSWSPHPACARKPPMSMLVLLSLDMHVSFILRRQVRQTRPAYFVDTGEFHLNSITPHIIVSSLVAIFGELVFRLRVARVALRLHQLSPCCLLPLVVCCALHFSALLKSEHMLVYPAQAWI